MALAPSTAEKLVKVARLTESPIDGESLAASRKLNALLSNAGLTWDAVFGAALQSPTTFSGRATTSPPCYDPTRWRRHLWEVKCWQDRLRPKDRSFIAGVDRRTSLSEKQHAWLKNIVERCASFAKERGA